MQQHKFRDWLGHAIKKDFVSGLLFLVPFLAAVLILVWFFNSIDGILQPIIRLIFGREVIGLGLVSTIILIYGVGILWHNVLGRNVLKAVDKGLEHVPIFSQIYTGAKQVMESLGGVKRAAFKETVLVDFPIRGIKAIAFITNEMVDENGEKIYVVYMPGSPNPTSGFLQLLREPQISRPDLAVDCAMRMIVSCGMVTPEKCRGFGLADGYRSAPGAIPSPLTEGEVPPAVPITFAEVEKLTVKSCKLEEQEKMQQQAG